VCYFIYPFSCENIISFLSLFRSRFIFCLVFFPSFLLIFYSAYFSFILECLFRNIYNRMECCDPIFISLWLILWCVGGGGFLSGIMLWLQFSCFSLLPVLPGEWCLFMSTPLWMGLLVRDGTHSFWFKIILLSVRIWGKVDQWVLS
jgi:hypothetical protein